MDNKTKEIVERLRAIDEDAMYCFPVRTYETVSEAASLIESLSERVGELENVAGAIFSKRDGAYGTALIQREGAVDLALDLEQLRRALLSKQEERKS